MLLDIRLYHIRPTMTMKYRTTKGIDNRCNPPLTDRGGRCSIHADRHRASVSGGREIRFVHTMLEVTYFDFKTFRTSIQFKKIYGKYEIDVAVAAPTAPYSGIKIKFKTMFSTILTDKLTALFLAKP